MISGKAIRTGTAPVSNKAPKKKAKNITILETSMQLES